MTLQGCDTVLLDVNGHVVDFVTALLSEKHTALIVSPGNAARVTEWVKDICIDGELKVGLTAACA